MSFERVYAQEGSPSPAPRRVPQYQPIHVEPSTYDTITPPSSGSDESSRPINASTRPGFSKFSRTRFGTSDYSTRPSLARFMKPKPEFTHTYSESWQRLERGEKLPAPPRPSSSSSEDGTPIYPPGQDRDFGWFARQRERDDRILAIKLARHQSRLTEEGKKRYDWKNWKRNADGTKEYVPPTGTSTHMEELKENVPPTGTYIQMNDMKENVPPAVEDSDSEREHADPEQTWGVDFTAQSLNTSPKLRIVENVSAIMEHPAETQEDEAREPVPNKEEEKENVPAIMEPSAERKKVEAKEPEPKEHEPKEAKQENVPATMEHSEAPDEMWETLRSLSRYSSRCSTPKTPKVTGAYIETPAPEGLTKPDTFTEQETPAPAPEVAGAYIEIPAPRESLKKHEAFTEQEAPSPGPKVTGAYIQKPARTGRFTKAETFTEQEALTPAPEVTGAYIETPVPRESLKKHETFTEHKAPIPAAEPTKPKVHNSAKPPTFKEDLRRIKLEADYADSTDDDLDAMLAPDGLDSDRIVLARMGKSLKITSQSIRDARLGIERLESRVSSYGGSRTFQIQIGFPKWLVYILLFMLALFGLVMAIGAYQCHVEGHVVPHSAADWWDGRDGPVVVPWGGKWDGFSADEFL
jgi:hypothetical protein